MAKLTFKEDLCKGCGLCVLNVLPAADTRIKESLPVSTSPREPLQRITVKRLPLALDILLVPVESQPLQILDGRRGRAGLVTGMVEVLHPKDHLAAQRSRPQPRDHERTRVPQVQRPRRRRRQSADIAHLRPNLRIHSSTLPNIGWQFE